MGLAPYGEPKFVDQFRKLVRAEDRTAASGSNMEYFIHHYSAHWTTHDRRWERAVRHSRRASPGRDRATPRGSRPLGPGRRRGDDSGSGARGAAKQRLGEPGDRRRRGLNSVANWKIEQEGIFKNVWIQPAAGDDGGALGAALLVSQQLFQRPALARDEACLLRPGVLDDEIEEFPAAQGDSARAARRRRAGRAGRRLHRRGQGGRLVSAAGWSSGRARSGPGRSSPMPRNPEMKAIINRKIKYPRVFSAVRTGGAARARSRVLRRRSPAPRCRSCSRCRRCVPRCGREIPAVTHEDGSGRVQTVTEDSNPLYYRLLQGASAAHRACRSCSTPASTCAASRSCARPKTPTTASSEHAASTCSCWAITWSREKPDAELDVESRLPAQRRPGGADRRGAADEPDLPATIDGPAGARRRATAQRATCSSSTRSCRSTTTRTRSTRRSSCRARTGSRSIPASHRHLRARERALRVLDVGCGAGWFVNSCAHYYGALGHGLDINPVVLRQARSVARLMPGCEARAASSAADVFAFEPDSPSTSSIRWASCTIRPIATRRSAGRSSGSRRAATCTSACTTYYGRRPFLDHFAKLRATGRTSRELYARVPRLNPDISDATHLLSWFRDQVLHPHETQHTYEEIQELLAPRGSSWRRRASTASSGSRGSPS